MGRADLDKVQWVTLQRASEARQRSLAIGRVSERDVLGLPSSPMMPYLGN